MREGDKSKKKENKKKNSKSNEKLKSLKNHNHSKNFFNSDETIKIVLRNSKETVRTVQADAERNKDLEKGQGNEGKSIRIRIKAKMANRKTVDLDLGRKRTVKAIETAERERTKSAATRSQRSIRRNIRKTDQDLRIGNIHKSVEKFI